MTSSAYEVFLLARMFPPTKRWVMMLGLFTPESSVWTWKTRPACEMLWLKPLTARSKGLAIAEGVSGR